ncbi:MAG TPA: efflux RND transporter periplasmic adaptor subunit [Magnetospirillaceae bacterium]|jgi:multidrug efflux system membrane fusion protein
MSKLRTLIVIVVVVAAGFVAWRWIGAKPATAEAQQAKAPAGIPVDATAASRQTVPLYMSGLGTVQAFNTVTVTARVDGQLQKVNFIEGQEVKKGDVLAQIDPRPYKAQLDMAIAKKAQDEAQLANSNRDLKRYTELAQKDFASRQQVDTTGAQSAALVAQIAGDQAAIDNAKIQLDYSTITAPIDGRTGIRLIDEGNIIRAAGTAGIVVITQLHPISVIFTLPQDDLPQVSAAMAAGPVQVAAIARDNKTVLDSGKIALIDNQIDQTTGTIRLRANFDNPHDSLWPGEFVNARVLLKDQANVLTIPSAAVQRGVNGFFVYVVKPDNTVDARPIKVSMDNGSVAVIEDGVSEGEKVVTRGQYRLEPGAPVRIVQPKDSVAEKSAQ